MTTPLNTPQVTEALQELPGWSFADDKLVKTFSFSSFKEAVSFIVRVAFEAEQLNHHPEIRNVYSRVEIGLTTHDAGDRVTGKDVELATSIEGFSWV